MAIILVVLWLIIVPYNEVYTTDSVIKNEPKNQQMFSKRLLMDENYYSLNSKIDNLTNRVEALEKENGEHLNKYYLVIEDLYFVVFKGNTNMTEVPSYQ